MGLHLRYYLRKISTFSQPRLGNGEGDGVLHSSDSEEDHQHLGHDAAEFRGGPILPAECFCQSLPRFFVSLHQLLYSAAGSWFSVFQSAEQSSRRQCRESPPTALRQVWVDAVYRLAGYSDQVTAQRPKTAEEPRITQYEWLILFFFYLANYFVISYFNVAFASVVLNHLDGGHATLNDGLQVAWTRKGSILQWAILASTVGIVLKMISKRSQLGRWIASILGYTWRLGSYFAIPILAMGNMGAGEALQRSATVLKDKWGEVVVAQFSFSLLFTLLAIPGAVLFFLLAGFLGQSVGFVTLMALTYWVWLSIFIFSAEQVFIAALYRYATQNEVSKGFSKNDLQSAWEGLQPLPIGQAL